MYLMTFHRQPILFSFDCQNDKQQNRERNLWLHIKHYLPILVKRPKKNCGNLPSERPAFASGRDPQIFPMRNKNVKHFCRELKYLTSQPSTHQIYPHAGKH